MDEVLLTIIFLICVIVWRGMTMGDNCLAKSIQKVLHLCGPVAAVLQWYTILFIGMLLLLARTFFDIVLFDFIKADLLKNTPMLWKVPQEDRDDLEITPWLRVLALMAPICGLLAGVVVTEHAARMIFRSMTRQKVSGATCVWSMSKEMGLILFVIAMPIVFVVMSMRAEIRVLSVMTGTCKVGGGPWTEDQIETDAYKGEWSLTKGLEGATYTADLEIAGFFQYMTIFSFGRLCVFYLRRAPVQYRWALQTAGLQGVYLYVLFGMLRCMATFANVVLESVYHKAALGAIIQDKVLTFLGPITTVATVLCVLNMLIIGKMDDVVVRLGGPGKKFNATRFLVLISQVQKGVLLGLVAGGAIYNMLDKPGLPPFLHKQVQAWHFSTERAELMHACLLSIECLLVALVNRCVWPTNQDYTIEYSSQQTEPLLQAEA